MARLLCAKRCLSSVSLLSSSSSIKCCSTTSTTTTTFNHSHSSIKSFPLFSPLPTLLSQQFRSINSSSSSISTGDRFGFPGCDLKHWFIVMNQPLPDTSRDEIISSYIKTLATVVGSEEKARMKIYSVSTRYYYAFGARISQNVASRLKGVKNVRFVLPDSYMDIPNKDYGGEPFIDGQPVPYDPKYHKVWVENKKRAERFLIQPMKLKEQYPELYPPPSPRSTAERVERKFKALYKKEKASESAKEKNKPKRPTPVFLVFMEDFRKTYKEEHRENKSVVEVAKEGSKKWKTLTNEEKKQYFIRAAERVA